MSKSCSEITLPEVGRLIKDMLEKLNGSGGTILFKALKLCLRINPEILLDKVLSIPVVRFSVQSRTSTPTLHLLHQLGREGVLITGKAKDIISKPQFEALRGIVDWQIVQLRARDFFKKSIHRRSEVDKKSVEMKLQYLSPDIALLLPLMPNFSLAGESWMLIYHPPIDDSKGYPHQLYLVIRDNNLWIDAFSTNEEVLHSSDGSYLFQAPA